MWVTTMHRNGDFSGSSHSYVLGVFDTKEKAEIAGDCEKTWRACKYDYKVVWNDVNGFPHEKVEFHNSCCDSNILKDIFINIDDD